MTIQQKLQTIQALTGKTQETLAKVLGVSFPAFNAWSTGKAQPRPSALARINALYVHVGGRMTPQASGLEAKKLTIQHLSRKHPNVLKKILARKDLHDSFMLALTFHTNRIEGSTVTEDETAAILFDHQVLRNRTLVEQQEVKNHQAALDYLLHHLQSGKRIDEVLILRLHGILLNAIQTDAGSYRQHAVRIVGANVPTANYLKVPVLMKSLASGLEKKVADSISATADVHARFEQVHPFADGNGRIGRLLITAMLLRANIAPAIIEQRQRRTYMRSLNVAQTTSDSIPLQEFLSDAVLKGYALLV
ncbi:MAG: Fic family protein [Patescibacteria group bacterium]|jgi:Fic family protein